MIKQAHSKYAKAKQTLDLCEASYQSSVTSIEEARKSWEKETEKSLSTFQGLEEDRLAHVRDSLWRVANISSLAAVADDLAAEEVRKTLEVTDLDDSMQGFINENATGTYRYSCTTLLEQGISGKISPHQADLNFLMRNEPYFHVGYVTKLKADASQILKGKFIL